MSVNSSRYAINSFVNLLLPSYQISCNCTLISPCIPCFSLSSILSFSYSIQLVKQQKMQVIVDRIRTTLPAVNDDIIGYIKGL
jgi:hypothetical protein